MWKSESLDHFKSVRSFGMIWIRISDTRSLRSWYIKGTDGCFPLCQRFRKFRSEVTWKGPFRFLPTRIFGITSRGARFWSVEPVRPKFAVPFWHKPVHCPTSVSLWRESGKGIKNGKSHSSSLARFDRKMSFQFARVFPLVSDQLFWHNEAPDESNLITGSSVSLMYHDPSKRGT